MDGKDEGPFALEAWCFESRGLCLPVMENFWPLNERFDEKGAARGQCVSRSIRHGNPANTLFLKNIFQGILA